MSNIILSVSQVNSYIKSLINSDYRLSRIFIRGEISNFVNHIRSGHYYFSLKDETGVLKAVMFKGSNQRLKFMPENGMKVVVMGRIDLYERDGVYQLYCEDMLPDGVGALYKAYEQLKNKLDKLGIFDNEHKQFLPQLPKKVGVITSPTGAVRHDIQQVMLRRFPLAEIIFCGVQVQGEEAPAQIVDAIERFNRLNACDVLIVGRGGGSIEDLWAFNNESVVMAIYNSKIPIISAVGHETDTTLSDLVADVRAATPSVAAELAVPDSLSIKLNFESNLKRMRKIIIDNITFYDNKLQMINKSNILKNPTGFIDNKRLYIDSLSNRMNIAHNTIFNENKSRLAVAIGKLNTLNPLSILSRGYSVAKCGENVIKSTSQVNENQQIQLILTDGKVNFIATQVEKESKIYEKKDEF